MKHQHVSPLRFVSLLLNDDALADGEAKSPFFWNLTEVVGQCPRCRREVLNYYEFSSMAALQELESPALDLVERRQRIECQPLLAWLDHLPAAERLAAKDDPAYLRPQVVEGLLARCRERWSEAPREALADAQLATQLARRLVEDPAEDETFLPEFDQPPLLARAWGAQGNVLRILGELPAAAKALAKAGEWAEQPVVDKAVRAEVLSFSASLAIDRHRFGEARRLLEEAAQLCGGFGGWHELGRVLLQRAKLELEAGRPLEGLRAVRRAESMLEPGREPVLRWVAANIHLHILCDLGRFAEAERVLPQAQELCRRFGGALEGSRISWCEGRIESGLGRASAAEAAFHKAHQAFLNAGIASDVALITLDLAALYAAEGRWAEIAPLAAEVIPVLQAQGIEREPLAALLLLAEANEQQLAAGLVAEARQRFEVNHRH